MIKQFSRQLVYLLLAVYLPSGNSAAAAPRAAIADAQLEATAHRFIEQFLKTNPEQATALGDHRFDGQSRDLSARGLDHERKLYRATIVTLKRMDLDPLSIQHRIDYRILMNELEGRLFAIEVLKEQEWDALSYNPAGGIYVLLARDFAPLPQRLASVKARLDTIPRMLAVAKINLRNPPRVQTETAIEQNKGAIALVRDELETYLKDAPRMKATLAPSQQKAVAALAAYGTWLKKELLPRSKGDFRLGAVNYRRKLRYALESDISPEEILRRAEADLLTTHQALYETAVPLYRQYFPLQTELPTDRKALVRAVLKKLGDNQPNNENVVRLAEEDLAAATAFIREKGLLTLPEDPVKVIVMPEFQRGVATANCDAPGALEKNLQTFFCDLAGTGALDAGAGGFVLPRRQSLHAERTYRS